MMDIMRPVLVTTGVVVVAISLIVGFFTLTQVNQEQLALTSRLQSRTQALADSLSDSITPAYRSYATTSVKKIIDKMVNDQRIAGLGVFDNIGSPVATSSELPDKAPLGSVVARSMDTNEPVSEFDIVNKQNMFVFVNPLHGNDNDTVIGALVVVQSATYIDDAIGGIWRDNLLRLFLQLCIFTFAIFVLMRWILFKPLQHLAESVKAARRGDAIESKYESNSFLQTVSTEISKMSDSLRAARNAASEEARLRFERIETPWTEERLKQFIKDILKDRKVVAVSNLEPYIHTKAGSGYAYHVPASGLITAIEPVMQACGGLWIAQGSGEADRLTVDAHDRIQVPPEHPKYTLRRVWLSKEEEKGHNYGFSDQAMYPLSLMAHTRPVFREEDWQENKKVNSKFAQTVLEEIQDVRRPLILVQDFQFTLISRTIKEHRPDAVVGIFWHLPWVSAEAFSICPWKKEILDGMLGADLIGFHTQLHCNNFIETVGRELEALIDYEQGTITRGGHTSYVKPFPISVAFTSNRIKPSVKEQERTKRKELLKSLSIQSKYVGIGVDRLDHVKGIAERLIGIEIFFTAHPEFLEQFTFIQISSPSETKSKEYLEFVEMLNKKVERINSKFQTKYWKPIVFLPKHHSHAEIDAYYKLADLCLVTPLHDGMNLVAKEFIASRDDEKGVLVLSQFAGASKELKDALIINPYNGMQTADAIHVALTMTNEEQARRMHKMREVVKNYTIYRWSAEFIKALIQLD